MCGFTARRKLLTEREGKDTAQGDFVGGGTQEGCIELLGNTWVEEETSAKYQCREKHRVIGAKEESIEL